MVPGNITHRNVSGANTQDVDSTSTSGAKNAKYYSSEMPVESGFGGIYTKLTKMPNTANEINEIRKDFTQYTSSESCKKLVGQCGVQLDAITEELNQMGEDGGVEEFFAGIRFPRRDILIILAGLIRGLLEELMARAQMTMMAVDLSMQLAEQSADEIRAQGWAALGGAIASGAAGVAISTGSMALSFKSASLNSEGALAGSGSVKGAAALESGSRFQAGALVVNSTNSLVSGSLQGGAEVVKSGMSAEQKIYEQESNLVTQLAQQEQQGSNNTLSAIAEILANAKAMIEDQKQAADKAAVDC